VAYFKIKVEQGGCPLTVRIKIILCSLEKNHGKYRVQHDGEKVIQFGPPEPGFVKSLQKENKEMDDQKCRKHIDIGF
jgi:hypothetical protein